LWQVELGDGLEIHSEINEAPFFLYFQEKMSQDKVGNWGVLTQEKKSA
jgi:hypothetical protein